MCCAEAALFRLVVEVEGGLRQGRKFWLESCFKTRRNIFHDQWKNLVSSNSEVSKTRQKQKKTWTFLAEKPIRFDLTSALAKTFRDLSGKKKLWGPILSSIGKDTDCLRDKNRMPNRLDFSWHIFTPLTCDVDFVLPSTFSTVNSCVTTMANKMHESLSQTQQTNSK